MSVSTLYSCVFPAQMPYNVEMIKDPPIMTCVYITERNIDDLLGDRGCDLVL